MAAGRGSVADGMLVVKSWSATVMSRRVFYWHLEMSALPIPSGRG